MEAGEAEHIKKDTFTAESAEYAEKKMLNLEFMIQTSAISASFAVK
jgi:hypothetical protein